MTNRAARRPPARNVGRRGLPRPIPYDVELLGAWLAEHGPTSVERRRLDEWQYAADAASVVLAIDAAQQYGLVTGGPVVNVERAVELLDQAERRGITPAPDAVEKFLPAFLAPGDSTP